MDTRVKNTGCYKKFASLVSVLNLHLTPIQYLYVIHSLPLIEIQLGRKFWSVFAKNLHITLPLRKTKFGNGLKNTGCDLDLVVLFSMSWADGTYAHPILWGALWSGIGGRNFKRLPRIRLWTLNKAKIWWPGFDAGNFKGLPRSTGFSTAQIKKGYQVKKCPLQGGHFEKKLYLKSRNFDFLWHFSALFKHVVLKLVYYQRQSRN